MDRLPTPGFANDCSVTTPAACNLKDLRYSFIPVMFRFAPPCSGEGSAQPSARHQARRSMKDRRPYRTRAPIARRRHSSGYAPGRLCRPLCAAVQGCPSCPRHPSRRFRPSVTACRSHRPAITARQRPTGSRIVNPQLTQASRRAFAPNAASCWAISAAGSAMMWPPTSYRKYSRVPPEAPRPGALPIRRAFSCGSHAIC